MRFVFPSVEVSPRHRQQLEVHAQTAFSMAARIISLLGLILGYSEATSNVNPLEQLTSDRPCGSGWVQNLLLPQGFGRADFRPCCLAHDACYGTCGSNKTTCDADILSCTVSRCTSAYGREDTPISFGARVIRAGCVAAGNTGFGLLQTPPADDAFNSAQTRACANLAANSTVSLLPSPSARALRH